MINLNEYFCVWKWRLSSLDKAFENIKFLPEDSRFMQAHFVRNDCLDLISELESVFPRILANFASHQDEIFMAAADDLRSLAFEKKSWPLDSVLHCRVKELKKDFARKTRLWARQATNFEENFMNKKGECVSAINVIINKLFDTYGVSPGSGK